VSELSQNGLWVLERFVEHERLVRAVDYRGYEFDDLRGSPLVRALSFENLLLKRVFIQVGERVPWNIRPLLGVQKLPSSKGAGFFARGYLDAYRATGDGRWLDRATALLDWLLEHAAHEYSGPAWGNAFEFASRAGAIPKGMPTVVWTSHIGEAFALAHSVTGESRYREVVVGIGEFVLRDLSHREDEHGVCIAYTPLSGVELIHNSNLLGAVALLRAWSHDSDDRKLEVAERAFSWSLHHMNTDGSWYYGVGPRYAWIDNFHTAYVIDCLIEGRKLTQGRIASLDALERSIAFWQAHFFEPDGTPRYYHDELYPLDSQCVAQAIETFARLSAFRRESLGRSFDLLQWSVANFRRSDGFYFYRKGRFFTNRLIAIHWAQATMFAAMGALLYYASREL